ncbi:glycosyltransferase family 32 protein [Lasiosphaeria ovina]|uniref:Glycosyltransferase family 32 protein n=1 Tax=Lasiosphaeria ovina TaxID=92902 RepID=A0AAE0JSC5_9PEZI|nr:glycosyltransferase family 32 protein [Lasiosphaeria ovina]
MRFRPLVAALLLALTIWVLFDIAARVVRFIHIFGVHAGPALTQEEVEAAFNAPAPGNIERQQYVPKIIHQIFHNWKDPKNETLPADWEASRRTCSDKNPNFEYHLWTEPLSLEFIATNYEWFLPTYKGYRYPVQRVDALKYFLLLHFGGIYIDLDNGCSRDLEPLLYYPTWVADGGQGTLSNNILGARPHHPYWAMMTNSLIPWGYKYPFPYFTVHYSSGQWFETAIWEIYHEQLPARPNQEDRLYRVMMDNRVGGARWVFFTEGRGGSWDNWDNHLFSFMGNRFVPWVVANFIFIILGAVAVAAMIWYRKGGLKRFLHTKSTFNNGRLSSMA